MGARPAPVLLEEISDETRECSMKHLPRVSRA